MRALIIAACCLPALGLPALSQPSQPAESAVDATRCQWQWKEGGGIGVWAERCALETGVWELKFREDLPGFVLTKADKLSPTALAEIVEATRKAIAKRPAAYPEIVATSAETGLGIDVLRAEIAALA